MTRQIAAFDFDGTLAKGDSLLPFFLRVIGARRLAHSLLVHAPALGAIGIGKGNRDRTKEKFIAHVLAGHPADEIHALGEEFAHDLIETRLFPAVTERVEWHRNEGHELALVSATLDCYLKPFARDLGFHHVVTTRLEIVDGKATGRLIGNNVRAAEKARLLNELLGDEAKELWAYGNSSGDYEMLAMADHPFWVTKKGTVEPFSRLAS